MEAELDEHLGHEEHERSDNPDYRNGVKFKKLRSSYGEIPIDESIREPLNKWCV